MSRWHVWLGISWLDWNGTMWLVSTSWFRWRRQWLNKHHRSRVILVLRCMLNYRNKIWDGNNCISRRLGHWLICLRHSDSQQWNWSSNWSIPIKWMIRWRHWNINTCNYLRMYIMGGQIWRISTFNMLMELMRIIRCLDYNYRNQENNQYNWPNDYNRRLWK